MSHITIEQGQKMLHQFHKLQGRGNYFIPQKNTEQLKSTKTI